MTSNRLVVQSTPAPVAKVKAAGVGGIAAAFVLGGLDALNALDLPTLADSLLPVVVAVIAGYIKKAHASDR